MGRKAKKATPKKNQAEESVQQQASVQLSFAGPDVTFRDESVSVQVSRDLAEQSQLLVELRDQEGSAEDIPIALAIETVQAWQKFLQANQAGSLSNVGVTTLLGALEAADFLRDDDTIAKSVDALCRAFTPPDASTTAEASAPQQEAGDAPGPASAGPSMPWQWYTSPATTGHDPGPPPPTDAQREQAFEIFRAAPGRNIPRLLAALHPQPSSTARLDRDTQRREAATLKHLLMLLPPTLHPAVLYARFPSMQHERALSLPDVSPPGFRNSSMPGRASLTLHALAAAAVFATGSPADAWRLAAADPKRTLPALKQLSRRPVSLALLRGQHKRCRDGDGWDDSGAAEGGAEPTAAAPDPPLPHVSEEMVPAEAMAPEAALTRLSLCIGGDCRQLCAGLGVLRTLCDLRLRVSSVDTLDVKAFAAATRALPALARLHIKSESMEHIDWSTEAQARDVLGAVAALPRLAALGLEGVFGTDHMFKRRRDPLGKTSIEQLSRLTGLTYLSLRDNVLRRKDAGVRLGQALRRMKKLQQLSIANMDEGVEYALQVYVRGGFPELQALDLGAYHLNRFFRSAPAFNNMAATPQLTALGFAWGDGRGIPSEAGFDGEKLAALPQWFPKLQVLNLRGNGMRDRGLNGLAAVLPQLTALESLDIGFNVATHESVLAVVAAAEKLCKKKGKKKGGGLRRLGVAGAAVGPERAEELAGLLAQLPALEEVDMASLELGAAGVRAAVQALAGLKQLRALNVSDNGQSAVDVEATVPLLARLKGLRRLVMHETKAGEAVRAAVEGAAPWLQVITLGQAAHADEMQHADDVVAWGDPWKPMDDGHLDY